ncbi:MAG: Lrp/AsnC family transcriptional regulator [Thermomicrobiales bacterium]|nr:Lrp/AsnC family transcriptional regulator [Thermomicrobiales bacterium]
MSAAVDSGSYQVDELDLRILDALQPDGRKPVAEVSRELGIPKSTVQRRLDVLIRNEIVRFAGYANSERLGLNMHVHLNLKVDLANYQGVIDAVGRLTEVRWLAVTTGPYDLVAEAYFASSTHLHEFIRDRLAPIPGVTSVETSVILAVEKMEFHWGALLQEAQRHATPHVRMSSPDCDEQEIELAHTRDRRP